MIKGKRVGQLSSIARNLKGLNLSECSFDADQRGRETGSIVSTAQDPAPVQFVLATRYRSRRKNNLLKIWNPGESSGSDTISRKRLDKQATSLQDKAILVKVSNWLLH